jgi:type IV pilus assembly protein PilV
MMIARRKSGSPSQGFALLEVLMSIVLFSIGVLGLLILHAKAMQFSIDSENRSRAAVLANELAGKMWATGSVSLASGTITTWQTAVANTTSSGLPSGTGSVAVASSVATITVTWTTPWQSSSEQSHSYVTQVMIP